MAQRIGSGSVAVAGLLYFAIAFGCGFALGVLRVLAVAPAIGAFAATALELPVMLGISWLAARWVIVRAGVGARLGDRLAMGGLAFGLLMLAEAGLAVFGLGQTLAEHLASYGQPERLLGLAAQMVFGIIPVARIYLRAD